MRTGTDSNNTQQQTIHALLASAETMRQSLYDGIQYARGGFISSFFKLSEIKVDPKTAERLAFMARK